MQHYCRGKGHLRDAPESPSQILLPLLLRKLLDGVPQHRARHLLIARFQIVFERLLVLLACLAEQPAYGFVDQVVRVVQEDIGNGKSVVELPVADESHGADDADTLLPERLAAARELIEQGAVLVQQPFAQ